MTIQSRKVRTSINIFSSLLCQAVVLVCGLIVPRVLMKTFGSEIYGATTSIAQFLSYIALIEGGIGGVARSELYKPLSENDTNKIGLILKTLRSFFFKIGLIFIIYVFVIGVLFKDISSIESLDWSTCFFLVIVISISNLGQYFIGITYGILLQADQKNYIIDIINIITTILNTALVVLFVYSGFNIVFVKLASSCVFLLRPLIYFFYVKYFYHIPKNPQIDGETKVLKDGWVGFGQHIAYFVHCNTDVVLLTFLTDLKAVAVYGVYALVTSNMQSFISSFGSGMEGLFGEMLAKKEDDNLKNVFSKYESFLSFISIVIFSTTFILIVPFVKLYTEGITDTNYIQPLFALFMVIASFVYIIRLPYHNLIIASGKFKETNVASYGEALINIAISIVCVQFFGLAGVAIGTCAGVIFRYAYYLYFVNKNILKREKTKVFGIIALTCALFFTISGAGYHLVNIIELPTYFYWALAGIFTVLGSAIITSIAFIIFNKKAFSDFVLMLKNKVFRRSNG